MMLHLLNEGLRKFIAVVECFRIIIDLFKEITKLINLIFVCFMLIFSIIFFLLYFFLITLR